ncbi:hypothetical protein KAFR_0B03010 [Kazachstania africana CBS 2517]|uniref:UDENN domain-containing protein n=1 Tax=Kazachstania africana (strain ATCC 22294 / BCRC 22015 / CBS 2517 / CECT 1963 / NBRC 1671 / NRRL Y-8276) TaxID=1071382 RepID=H2AQE7_KAZAF|nr:hypothetical protein KAFR_0B03010 [Kazachstania africana CBS 2517]CCF56597.1 hypothetical protein KAFR_0B03010 [Kazachstania africana CBS 2517]
MADKTKPSIVGICLVDFHHKRGPEVEYWHGLPEGTDAADLWPNLPFQALPDGSHSFEESFTYFTLLFNEKNKRSPVSATDLPEDELDDYTTFFAISCSRQIKSDALKTKDKDVTRSTVQKSIVVISRQPLLGQIKDKLSIVTNAFFMQHDFTDKSLIDALYSNLQTMYGPSINATESSESEAYVGLSLRKMLHDFKKDTLVLLKAMLLEKKIVFYSSNAEVICNLQFGLISLIPLLVSNLENCGSPLLFKDFSNHQVADSFKTSERKQVLRFLGFPLQIFEKGGLFSPYTPLQQLGDIKSSKTKYFLIGTSNSLLSEQKEDICDIFVNVDNSTVQIMDKELHTILQLTTQDKKWMDGLFSVVNDTWDKNDEEVPTSSQFEGSEDFIRWQFEDYLSGLVSSVKLYDYLNKNSDTGNLSTLQGISDDVLRSNPWNSFNLNFIKCWKETQNFKIFISITDDRLFDVFAPKHIYTGGDAFKQLQQKFITTFQNLKHSSSHLDFNRSNSSDNKLKFFREQSKEDLSLSQRSTHTSSEETASIKSNKDQNIWATWKDYFNRKKNKENMSSNDLKSQDTVLIDDQKSIRSPKKALFGLGIRFEEKHRKKSSDAASSMDDSSSFFSHSKSSYSGKDGSTSSNSDEKDKENRQGQATVIENNQKTMGNASTSNNQNSHFDILDKNDST